MEINPEHPVSKIMHDQWHKLLAIVMAKHGLIHVIIQPEDISLLQGDDFCIVVKDGENGDGNIHLRLVSMNEGKRLAEGEK